MVPFPIHPLVLAMLWHRRQGDVILVLFLLIAYHCLRYGYIDPDSPRVLSHSVLGSLTLAVLAAILLKLVTVRWIPRLMERIAVIGASLFVLTTGTVLTSALWCFLAWIREGARPTY